MPKHFPLETLNVSRLIRLHFFNILYLTSKMVEKLQLLNRSVIDTDLTDKLKLPWKSLLIEHCDRNIF
jgi:hypothetical protein